MVGLYSTGWDQQNVVGNLVIQPLVFLGGVFYSIAALSEPWRALTHVDPIFYMVVAARHGMLGTSEVDAGVSVGVTLGLAARHGRLGLGDLHARGGNPHLTASLGSRRMEPGDILRRSWELYRTHSRHLMTIAAVVFVPLGAVIGTSSAWSAGPGSWARTSSTSSALFLVQGALVKAVDDVRDGRPDLAWPRPSAMTGPRLLVLAVAGVLAAVGIFIGLLAAGRAGARAADLVVRAVPGHRPGGRAASWRRFGRSRGLVRGHGWPVFGVAIVTLLVELVVSLALGAVVLPLGGGVSSFVQAAVGNSIVTPFVAVAATLTYFRLHEHPAAPGGR